MGLEVLLLSDGFLLGIDGRGVLAVVDLVEVLRCSVCGV
jgi:hypothetical protein